MIHITPSSDYNLPSTNHNKNKGQKSVGPDTDERFDDFSPDEEQPRPLFKFDKDHSNHGA